MLQSASPPTTPPGEGEALADGAIEGADYRSCLRGIAKRLLVSQSTASSGNVAQLISLSTSPALLNTTLRVLTAQRWHLRPGHEPLSRRFLLQAIKTWPAEEPAALAGMLESAVSADANFAVLLTPANLAACIEACEARLRHGPRTDGDIWAWAALALRLIDMPQACGAAAPEGEDRVAEALLRLLVRATQHLDSASAFEVAEGQRLAALLPLLVSKLLTAERVPSLDRFALAQAHRAVTDAGLDLGPEAQAAIGLVLAKQ